MPFVQRVVEPRCLSRISLCDQHGNPKVTDEELQAVTNSTLSNALRQLASLVLLAEDIFGELTTQLEGINERSKQVQTKMGKINEHVEKYDPKAVTVPQGCLSDFASRKVNYTAKYTIKKELFTPNTRPASVRKLYERAASSAVVASALDELRSEWRELVDASLLAPAFVRKRARARIHVDIETRIPSAVSRLRKWTSREAVGDVTVLPDASLRIASSVTLTPDELSECSGDDEPVDHRLPSPEEQLRVIASKFCPEVVAIDTSGRFFDRMCSSRRSLTTDTHGETDTVKRRTRSRKPRGKRRNTISGTDQKELREAVAGETSKADTSEDIESTSVTRSHSNDLLKRSPIDPNIKKGHFNTLKQWGKNRLKMIGRSPSASRDSFRDSMRFDKNNETVSLTRQGDNCKEVVTLRKKRLSDDERNRKSLERCASYSSSEKSLEVAVTTQVTATITSGVKLRTASTQKKLKRMAFSKEEPHSSSGNWSASSESGRTSIGSEVTSTTVPPRSTTSAATSNNSLNMHHIPLSSVLSRRRFLNTSGSGSVTSEGTLTPDIIHDLHEDLETSSEFSCDTEGYYTSFHMDSGLKTLKEEDLSPSTPMHTSTALSNSSNSQILSAENEYELFGKGSTSTTTSSAGTVCTTLMAAGSDRSLVTSPVVPERKSSLTKINRSRAIQSANATLERNINSSFSRSPYSSFRIKHNSLQTYNNSSPDIQLGNNSTVTITKNVGNIREMTAVAEVHNDNELEGLKKSTGTNSPDSGHNTSSSPIEDSISSAHGKTSLSEQDYSESSDLEGTDRLERIKSKTTINSSRIPSMCVITPTNSDEENESCNNKSDDNKFLKVVEIKKDEKFLARPKLDLPIDSNNAKTFNSSNANDIPKSSYKLQTQINFKHSLQPLNTLMCKLKGVLPQKLSSKKSPNQKEIFSDAFYDPGDYVTIADVRNNNQKANLNKSVYSNDIVGKNLQAVLSGKLAETEYVSLNELPNCLNVSKDFLDQNTPEKTTMNGAKVTLDSQGQVIYTSDTLKRRKGAHTTFEPGPCVQEICPSISIIQRENADIVKVVDETDFPYHASSKQVSPQLGRVIIKAPIEPGGLVTTEIIQMPNPKPNTIITATPLVGENNAIYADTSKSTRADKDLPRVVDAITRCGAFVNIQDAEGVNLSPAKDDPDYQHSSSEQDDKTGKSTTNVTRLQASHLRGRHGIISYNANDSYQDRRTFWSLPKKITTTKIQTTRPEQTITFRHTSNDNPNISLAPRNSVTFKSSTPTYKQNVDLESKMQSPIKSSMTNEELYSVIHKSKKKLNIRDANVRAESPTLSTLSISPVSSESSLYTKNFCQPETGYFADPKSRNSWSPSEKYEGYGFSRPATTCADRYGPSPQTSRLDFKRLLLQHSHKLNTFNPSSKSRKISAVEQLKISKEKTHSNNPVIDRSQINIINLSGSPKIYAHRKLVKPNVLPPSPGRTKENKSTPKVMLSPKSQWRFSSPRSDVLSSPIPEAYNEEESYNSSGEKNNLSPGNTQNVIPPLNHQTFGARRTLIPIVESENVECNKEPSPISLPQLSSRESLKARRAEFFNTPETSQPTLTSFKNPNNFNRLTQSPDREKSALETAL